jgi:predicted SAM-dependent methyltransferase
VSEFLGINAGSGQRRFDASKGWKNIDCNPRWEPDIVGDWNDLSMFENGTVDMVVAHQTIEHVGCGEADSFFRESFRVLKEGGSMIITIPDLKALAHRWMLGQIEDYTFMVNLYGAFMSDEADRHKWGYSRNSLTKNLMVCGFWTEIKPLDHRTIEGADIARDWWILGIEAIK